jgi:hypothetical protein
MAFSPGSVGVLLATLSDPAELADPNSLSCRITPGDDQSRPDWWQYEFISGRYPGDKAIMFSAKIKLPVSDLPEMVRRLCRPRREPRRP